MGAQLPRQVLPFGSFDVNKGLFKFLHYLRSLQV